MKVGMMLYLEVALAKQDLFCQWQED